MSKQKSKKKSPRSAGNAKKPQRPLLSVGIIFKNEIRCLERCLKSFQPLRERIPMEIVMADTGATDGSREIAERYADLLFDFPWINDFAAARNAVIDRCSGIWYLSVDADEWLDEDIDQLVDVLTMPKLWEQYNVCTITMYNYSRPDLRGGYSNFLAMRMFLISSGIRFHGAIHECITARAGQTLAMDHTVLHHDGYAFSGTAVDTQKLERNMAILREKLEKNPDNLMLLVQCAESSRGKEMEGYMYRAIDLVREKAPNWQYQGPVAFRNAIKYAAFRGLSEGQQWYQEALELFPDALHVRIDANAFMFEGAINRGAYRDAIPFGEEYLTNISDYREKGEFDSELVVNVLYSSAPHKENMIRLYLARAYFEEKRETDAVQMLETVDTAAFLPEDLDRLFRFLEDLESREVDTAALRERFLTQFRETNAGAEGDAGLAAALLSTEDPDELSDLLARVEKWDELPVFSLVAALNGGGEYPPPGRVLPCEAMDRLARRLPRDVRLSMVLSLPEVEAPGDLCWAMSLVQAAVSSFDWKKEGDEGVALARTFARIEAGYLPLMYSPAALSEEGLFLLPPAHRFGWHCVRAMEAADRGDELELIRGLRSALEANEGMQAMVEYLTDRTRELLPPPPPELLALADQVRSVLVRFAPDDPAVAELKASPVYQRVARIIEGE